MQVVQGQQYFRSHLLAQHKVMYISLRVTLTAQALTALSNNLQQLFLGHSHFCLADDRSVVSCLQKGLTDLKEVNAQGVCGLEVSEGALARQ
jgi:hypothetical protein